MSYTRTPEHRASAAARIKSTKPWSRSTGPRTAEGKARSSRNAFKDGVEVKMRALRQEVNLLLRELRQR